MKAPSRDTWLALSLFVVLAIITAAAAASQTRAAQLPALSSQSDAPNGGHALFLWLDHNGYFATDEVHATFQVPEFTRVVLLLEPGTLVLPEEWSVLDEWVADGGLLVVAGSGVGSRAALRHFEFGLDLAPEPVGNLAPAAPVLRSPPAELPAELRAEFVLTTRRDDFAVLMAAEAGPVIVSWAEGAGRVILSTTAYPFTNAGLKVPGNPELVLGLLSGGARSGWVWFDEWHHGRRGDANALAGPADWLRFTPAGRALLYVAAVVFVALLLSGRRFGRPTPLASEVARRTPLEYVTAMASLSRRAGHRAALLQQYRQHLKRQLGARYRLDPTLDDAEYVKRLAGYAPELDTAALARLLARLRAARVSEAELVTLAAEAAAWTKEHA